MKQLVLVLGCIMCLCYTTKSFAQSYAEEVIEENIILDDKNNESETTIEIKNGKLYVDGKKVSDIDKNTTVKIVKKNTNQGNGSFGMQQFDMPFKAFGRSNPRKAMLGVVTEDANPGTKINKIVDGSAADKAGLKIGDIIMAIDGKNIENHKDLVATISQHKKGDEIELELYRNDKIKKVNATLGGDESSNEIGSLDNLEQFQMPEIMDLRKMFNMSPGGGMVFSSESNVPKMGLEIEESENGLEIMMVEPNSAADKAGIKVGDEIKTVQGNSINTINELKSEITKHRDNKEIYFGVNREGALKSLLVVLPQAKRRAQF